jgi:hypothetical protein
MRQQKNKEMLEIAMAVAKVPMVVLQALATAPPSASNWRRFSRNKWCV